MNMRALRLVVFSRFVNIFICSFAFGGNAI